MQLKKHEIAKIKEHIKRAANMHHGTRKPDIELPNWLRECKEKS